MVTSQQEHQFVGCCAEDGGTQQRPFDRSKGVSFFRDSGVDECRAFFNGECAQVDARDLTRKAGRDTQAFLVRIDRRAKGS